MTVSMRPQMVRMEEPLARGDVVADSAALIDGGGEAVVTEFSWKDTPKGICQMAVQRLSVGSKTWTTEGKGGLYSDRALDEVDFPEDKALRTLSACTPVYLDDELLVMRAVLPSVVFVFGRG